MKPFRLTRPEPDEAQVQRAVLTALGLHPRVKRFWRQNTGAGKFLYPNGQTSQFLRFGFPGQPDVSGFMVDGRALFVEIKRPSGKLSREQHEFMTAARAAGCVVFSARSAEDVWRALGEREGQVA